MAFSGGGFFGTGASTSTSTSTATQQNQQTENGVNTALNLGDITAARGSEVNVDFVDYGAVAQAFNLGQAAIQANQIAETNALVLADSAIETQADLSQDTLEFAAGTIETNAGVLESALDAVVTTSEAARLDALEFAAGTIGAASEAQADSYQFSAGAVQEAFSFAQSGRAALDELLSQNAQNTLSVTQQTIAASGEARTDALEFGAGAFQTAINAVTGSFESARSLVNDAIGSISQAQSSTIATIGEQTKTESAQSFDRLVKLGAIAFVTLGAVLIFGKMR